MSVDSGIRHVGRRVRCSTAREEGSLFFPGEGRKEKKVIPGARSRFLKTNPKLGAHRAKAGRDVKVRGELGGGV